MKRRNLILHDRDAAARSSAFTRNPSRGTPRPGEVDLWRVPLDGADAETMARLQALLSADERSRASRFRFERDRARFIVGRSALRSLVGSYLGCAPSDVVFRYGPQGKPQVAFPDEDLHFNVTHSEGLAVCAFSRTAPLGVDIERVRDLPDWEAVARACFSRRDVAALRQLGEPQRRLEFFQRWTRQEACLKATGVGLGGPEADAAAGSCLSVHPLDVDTGFVGCLAALAEITQTNWNTWLAPDVPRPAPDPDLTVSARFELP